MEKNIPNRSVFRAAEVCEMTHIRPYVLRTWEQEFPSLGVPKAPGGARLYRKSDIEYVLRIKHLVFEEGLTLAGARRRLEEEQSPEGEEALPTIVAPEVREKIETLRKRLRELAAMLGAGQPSAGAGEATHDGDALAANEVSTEVPVAGSTGAELGAGAGVSEKDETRIADAEMEGWSRLQMLSEPEEARALEEGSAAPPAQSQESLSTEAESGASEADSVKQAQLQGAPEEAPVEGTRPARATRSGKRPAGSSPGKRSRG
jgi:DNA-binding transcriptional MerR regulator